MARLAIAAAVGIGVGFASGGTYGLQAFTLTYGALGSLDPNQKAIGPKLSDLKAPAASYGTPIPYLQGAPRVAGCVAYSTEKQPVETTTTQGKGGPGVDTVNTTYVIDCLIVLASNQCSRIRRIFSNGKLVWTNASAPAGSSSDTMSAVVNSLIASQTTALWREITFYDGNSAQLPNPVYEAAVGIGNAPAYRGRSSVFIEGLNLGNSGQLPVLTFEVCSDITPGSVGDTLGLILHHQEYQTSAIYVDSGGAVTVHVGYLDGGGSVSVRRLDALGSETVLNTYAYGSPNSAAGKGVIDRSVGIFCQNDTTLNTATIRLYGDNGLLQCTAIINSQTYGSEGPHYVLCGDDLIVGDAASVGTGKVYRISVSGQAVVATGVLSGVPVHSLAVVGTDVWCKGKTGPNLYRFDLSTMALDATVYVLPSDTSDSNGTNLMASEGRLYFAKRDAVATGRLFVREMDGSWTVVNPSLGSAAPYAVGRQAILGQTFYAYAIGGGVPNDTRQPIYRSSAAIDLTVVPLDQVVLRLCLRTGQLTAADLNVTALAGLYVRGLAVSQVSNTRTTLEMLMAAYLFEMVESGGKLVAVLRGAAPAMTIPYSDLGAGNDSSGEPLPIKRLNDIEIPARVTVKYANVSADYQDGAESGDRLTTNSTAESVVEIALGLLPSEAKKVADVNTMDLAVSMLQIGPISLPRKYAALEPTDVVILTAADGSLFRCRIVKATWGGGVMTSELVLDDATIINSAAATDIQYDGSVLVALLQSIQALFLDAPLLRDEDDGPGFYSGAKVSGPFSGGELDKSSDGLTYSKAATYTARAVAGTALTALPDFSGVTVDMFDTLTVEVGDGQLTSVTLDTLLHGASNALLIGAEILQYATATLVSSAPNVYLLSGGMLRGQRGTGWAMTGHAVGEKVTLLLAESLVRVPLASTELNRARSYRAVTFGQRISGAPITSLSNTGVSQKPFAVSNMGRDPITGDVVWNRRSRYAFNFLAPHISPALAEDTEAYDVEWRDTSAALVSTTTVTTPRFPLPSISPGYSVTVFQRSAAVGRGYPATLTV